MYFINKFKRKGKAPTKKISSHSSTGFTSSSSEPFSLTRDHEEYLMIDDSKSLIQLEKYNNDMLQLTQGPIPASNFEHDKHRDERTSPCTQCIYAIDRYDLHQISLIGSGRFCNVYSVSGILPEPCHHDDEENKILKKRSLLALKSMNQSRIQNMDDLIVAATDLANEAKILSQLDHKNIIRLRGVSKETFSQSFVADSELKNEGFFLVLDILRDTLSERLNRWRFECGDHFGVPPKAKKRSRTVAVGIDIEQRNDMYDRIENIALGVAEGMEYLHSHQIVLRDLKPSNIGFDFETGAQVRLFDFGMARSLSDCSSEEICGSPRYMAPEVMDMKGYTLKVDSYSFGVLLFEICSLCIPYEENYWNQKKKNYKRRTKRWSLQNIGTKNKSIENLLSKTDMLDNFYCYVVKNQLRPCDDLDSSISCSKIRDLINECWKLDPKDRPSFTEIISTLKVIFNRQ